MKYIGFFFFFFFFKNSWVCFTICCLGLMLGFFGGLLCYNFFSSDFSSKIFFWAFFFLESRTNKFFFIWGCSKFYLRVFSKFFLKGKQIKKFKLLYIIFFFRSGCSLYWTWHRDCPHVMIGIQKCSPQLLGPFGINEARSVFTKTSTPQTNFHRFPRITLWNF